MKSIAMGGVGFLGLIALAVIGEAFGLPTDTRMFMGYVLGVVIGAIIGASD